MIEISPSVLTNSIDNFKRFVKRYEDFESVDIDIIRQPFLEDQTVQLADVIDLLKDSTIKSLGFHLMVEEPVKELNLLKQYNLDKRALRIYLQQESNLAFLVNYSWPKKWLKGICLKLETKLKDLEFYKNFEEIQFMSIEIGAQGRSFDESVADKIEEARKMGYNKKISLDGGVNLKSANIIRHLDVQRVSPGSYFAKTEDVDLARMKLDLALNIKDDQN